MKRESRRFHGRLCLFVTSMAACILIAIMGVSDLPVAQAASYASGPGGSGASRLIPEGALGIHGVVTYQGNPISGIYLALRFYNGTTWSNQVITTTGADGSYKFLGAPTLEAGQVYYVRYENNANGNADNSNYLTGWLSFNISVYSSGADVDGGSFDIADVVMTAPDPYATITLPFRFKWTKRAATPTDSYELLFYGASEPSHGTCHLGYVGEYWMPTLPTGYTTGTTYHWQMDVCGPDQGYGISRYFQDVTISAVTTRFMFLPLMSR